MPTTTTTHRPIAVLHIARLTVPRLLRAAQGYVTAMTGNPVFPSPVPALKAVTQAIDDLTTAETAALARTRGAVAVRDDKRAFLVVQLDELCGYVQSVADANPATATAVIESAGMAVRKRAAHAKRTFGCRQGPLSGTAVLEAPSAGRRASYEWQNSVDGGKTWNLMPPTMQARTELSGIAPLTVLEVRYRTVTKDGASDWSAPVAMTVL